MKISYHEGAESRDPRAEIIQAQQGLRGIYRLLTLIDERKLEEMESEELTDMLAGIGDLGVSVSDAVLDSLLNAPRGAPPQ
jgi:hypothetical protein